uniref:Uncharacterized protein n=1 Tax=Chenopodium quinoa TaxID=63459 RepID=A0A803NB19_CHEQI
MGVWPSKEPPPPMVLVPPLFDFPPLGARTRMLESSYNMLFGKLALKCLFEDYFDEARNFSTRILLKPLDDPHVDLIATVSGPLDHKSKENVVCNAQFRWQRISPEDYGIMGLRYGSEYLSCGLTDTTFPMSDGLPKNAWLVSKMGRLTAGMQYEQLSGTKDDSNFKNPKNWSYAVGYGLGSGSPLSPSFNFCLELANSSQGKVGPLSSTLSLAFKSWWKPAFTISFSAIRYHTVGNTSFGFGIRVENLREASYERADPNFVMLTPSKEHIAESVLWKDRKSLFYQSDVSVGNFDGLPKELRPLGKFL